MERYRLREQKFLLTIFVLKDKIFQARKETNTTFILIIFFCY